MSDTKRGCFSSTLFFLLLFFFSAVCLFALVAKHGVVTGSLCFLGLWLLMTRFR